MRITRSVTLAGLLAGALVLTACGGTDNPTVAFGDDRSSAVTSTQLNDADVEFVSGMVPHHQQAVLMADMILAKEPSEPVRALAMKIKAAQEPEIEELNALLEGSGEEPAGGHDGGHAGDAMPGGHGGMMTSQQMQALGEASDVNAERMFLTMMIEHHRGAVEAAETVLDRGEDDAVADLATRIRDAQQAEIAEMEGLLDQL